MWEAFSEKEFLCALRRPQEENLNLKKNPTQLTLNREKSTLISLLEGWFDNDDELLRVELDAMDDIEDSPPSSDLLQISSSLAAFDVLVVGGKTAK